MSQWHCITTITRVTNDTDYCQVLLLSIFYANRLKCYCRWFCVQNGWVHAVSGVWSMSQVHTKLIREPGVKMSGAGHNWHQTRQGQVDKTNFCCCKSLALLWMLACAEPCLKFDNGWWNWEVPFNVGCTCCQIVDIYLKLPNSNLNLLEALGIHLLNVSLIILMTFWKCFHYMSRILIEYYFFNIFLSIHIYQYSKIFFAL